LKRSLKASAIAGDPRPKPQGWFVGQREKKDMMPIPSFNWGGNTVLQLGEPVGFKILFAANQPPCA
jgi:hypothetical protein